MESFETAVREFESGNYGRVVEITGQLIEADPRHAGAHRMLAAASLRLDRSERAEEAARKYLELKPEDPGGSTQLGQVLVRRGRIAEARRQFERALQIDPLHAEARTELQKLSWHAPGAGTSSSATPPTSSFAPGQAASSSESRSAQPTVPPPVASPRAVTPPRSWHHLLFKAGVVVAAGVIVSVTILPQWLRSRAVNPDLNPPQRTPVANRPPELVRPQNPNPNAMTQSPMGSPVNESLPPTPQPMPTPGTPPSQFPQQTQFPTQRMGPSPQRFPAPQGNRQVGMPQNNPLQPGANSGNQPNGPSGGSGSGTMACPICSGRGRINCPGPTASSAQALLDASALVLGGGSQRDICNGGTYRCANHRGEACENCGMDDASGRCPSCNGTGWITCPICGGTRTLDTRAIMGKFGDLGKAGQ